MKTFAIDKMARMLYEMGYFPEDKEQAAKDFDLSPKNADRIFDIIERVDWNRCLTARAEEIVAEYGNSYLKNEPAVMVEDFLDMKCRQANTEWGWGLDSEDLEKVITIAFEMVME